MSVRQIIRTSTSNTWTIDVNKNTWTIKNIDGTWGIRMNHELDEIIGRADGDVVTICRIVLKCCVARIDKSRIVKRSFERKHPQKRTECKHRERWTDGVDELVWNGQRNCIVEEDCVQGSKIRLQLKKKDSNAAIILVSNSTLPLTYWYCQMPWKSVCL